MEGHSKMPHYYFDIETTGLDPQRDQIVTIQYQKIDTCKGYAVGPLKILKSWDDGQSEKSVLSTIAPMLMDSNPFSFVPVGNNLIFDFKFLAAKFQQHLGVDVDTLYFLMRPHLDLKPLLIFINGGRFKGYGDLLGKQRDGEKVPLWHSQREYDKILEYVKNEAVAFIKFCSKSQQLLPNLLYRRLDDYV